MESWQVLTTVIHYIAGMKLAVDNIGVIIIIMATLGGLLYVVGGRGPRNEVHSTAERFDPVTSSWVPVPAMSTKPCGCGVAVMGGLIYVVCVWGGDEWQCNSEHSVLVVV